jgi:hypothetical protein
MEIIGFPVFDLWRAMEKQKHLSHSGRRENPSSIPKTPETLESQFLKNLSFLSWKLLTQRHAIRPIVGTDCDDILLIFAVFL